MPRQIFGVFVTTLSLALVTLATAAEREQLPTGVKPHRYDLALTPDLDKLTFTGRVQIAITVGEPTTSIVLNADELVFDKTALDAAENPTVKLDTTLQRATLQFAHPVSAGNHTLTIDYHGKIATTTLGFFVMDYDGRNGKRRTLATNFEPASERRFMPSWDEPSFKAVFKLTVDVPADRMAVSNMPVASAEKLGNGRQRVHFAASPKMSTYLYFLAIGDFERISTQSDQTEVGVVVSRGDTAKGSYALEQAALLLHYYNQYFGVAYPLPKLDLVAAPGAIQGGSMENWGAIFYSQQQLLFDPKLSTESDRRLVFIVVAHEMAHQWFGDLVTMDWWDNLWLNEGFARWMENKVTQDLHPNWEYGLRALAVAESGKADDALASTHPIVQPVLNAVQAEEAFDNITYAKGAAVIRMLEAYAGPDQFRDGVRRYMHAYAFGNTVDADLWREVQVTSGKPILEIEADFTRQPGVPLLRVATGSPTGGHDTLSVTEGRFASDPASIASGPPERWHIPLTISAGATSKTYLIEGSTPTAIELSGSGPVVVNPGQYSYARTQYPHSMIADLTAHIRTLSASDQLGVLYDTAALGWVGYAPITDYLDVARSIPLDAEPAVWKQVINKLSSIDSFYRGNPNRAAFVSFAAKTLRPLKDKLGWEAKAGEDGNLTSLRDSVLRALSHFGDRSVIEHSNHLFEAALQQSQTLSPETRRTVIQIVAEHADAQTIDRLMSAVRSSKNPLENESLLSALTQVADPLQADRVIDFITGPDAPAGTAPYNLATLAGNHPDLGWKRALAYISRPNSGVDEALKLAFMPTIAADSSELSRIEDLQKYADQNIPPSAQRDVRSAIATIKVNAAFKSERIPQIDKWLAATANQ